VPVSSGLFFALENKQKNPRLRLKEAKKICADCPVLKECAEHALHHEHYGVWGGMSERERRRVRSERGIVTSTMRQGAQI
jgi:WhiB family redox-sensing transcriptional regulator